MTGDINMKKTAIILLVVFLAFAVLGGCSKTENNGNENQPAESATPAPTADPNAEAVDISGMEPEDVYEFDPATGTISKFKAAAMGAKDIIIPNKISGVDVKIIGTSAFYGAGLDSVVLPETLTELGNNAFQENNLTEIVLPDSLRTVGVNAFAKNKLKTIDFPSGITEISLGMFRTNELETITIPETVTIVRRSAFAENILVDIVIPASVKQLESFAFTKNQLETVTLNEGLERIDGHVFSNNNISKITFPSTVKLMGEATDGASPVNRYNRYTFQTNQLEEITILGSNVEMTPFLLGDNNFFRDAYNEGGPGTYTGTQDGPWEKVSGN